MSRLGICRVKFDVGGAVSVSVSNYGAVVFVSVDAYADAVEFLNDTFG